MQNGGSTHYCYRCAIENAFTICPLKDLLAQRAALDAQFAQTKEAELSGAIQQVRDLMARYDLTIADLTARAPRGSKVKEPSKVAAKYRDQETGAARSGRGLKPKWLKAKIEAGAKIDDFAV